MNLILFDTSALRFHLMPFSFTRPIAAMRIGICTIAEKWQHYLGIKSINFLTEKYLRSKFILNYKEGYNLFINGALCPDKSVKQAINDLQIDQALVSKDKIIALKTHKRANNFFELKEIFKLANKKNYRSNIVFLHNIQQLFKQNATEIEKDFQLLTQNKRSEKNTDKHTVMYHSANIFISKNVNIRNAILNAEKGPIYLGEEATIEEGAVLKGPLALCKGAYINIGSKIKSGTTIGPYCKVGGEINNTLFFGYSNKVHDGFLGNSVIGEWCNLGAGTNSSNLKNNYSNVRLWNYFHRDFIDSEEMFAGLFMGDYSRCAINTMFNTGTIMGIGATIFGSGFPPKFIPSFSWGKTEQFDIVKLPALFETNRKVMQRRNQLFTLEDEMILKEIFDMTTIYRKK